MKAIKERWHEESDERDCMNCGGDGYDSNELDGDCVSCRGQGFNKIWISICNWCGNESHYCDCDEEDSNG